VCTSRESFNASLKGTKKRHPSLPGVRRADSAILRAAQPYRYAERNRAFHSLVILANLNNLDKHRTLQPVYFLPERFEWSVIERRDCEITETLLRARRRILQVGAELGRLPARKTGPEPYVKLEHQLATLPALNERLALGEWLTKVRGFVGGLLVRFAQPPEREFLVLELPTHFV
jgi:hypothetical protein